MRAREAHADLFLKEGGQAIPKLITAAAAVAIANAQQLRANRQESQPVPAETFFLDIR